MWGGFTRETKSVSIVEDASSLICIGMRTTEVVAWIEQQFRYEPLIYLLIEPSYAEGGSTLRPIIL